MKKIDMSTSVWEHRYRPQLIDDLVIPQEIKDKLNAYVSSESIPNMGLFSNLPGCILPGTNIKVKTNIKPIKYSEIMRKYKLSKSELMKLISYANMSKPYDENLITENLIKAVKLKGSEAKRFGKTLMYDKEYKDKHLKLIHWLNVYCDPIKAMDETLRLRKFSNYIDTNIKKINIDNFKKEKMTECLLKIKFELIYSKEVHKITDLYPYFDKQYVQDFWTIRGWSNEEAAEKIAEIQIDNYLKRERKYTADELRHQRGYGQTLQKFLDMGLSEKEAKIALCERQSTLSLKKCIEKYGKDEGTKKWKVRQEKWQTTLKSKPQEEIDEINRKKSSGYNNFKYPVGVKGKLYYIHFYNNELEFWKIEITKKELNERFRFNNINLNYDIIFEKEHDDIYDSYILEQKILSHFKDKRITINLENFQTTEAFSENVLKDFYESI